jgi:hypothetical protein
VSVAIHVSIGDLNLVLLSLRDRQHFTPHLLRRAQYKINGHAGRSAIVTLENTLWRSDRPARPNSELVPSDPIWFLKTDHLSASVCDLAARLCEHSHVAVVTKHWFLRPLQNDSVNAPLWFAAISCTQMLLMAVLGNIDYRKMQI